MVNLISKNLNYFAASIILILALLIPILVHRAQATTVAKSNTSAAEPLYNPFGDAWSTNTGANPDIPEGLTPGCHRNGPKTLETTPTDEEMTYLSKSNTPILFEECAVVGGVNIDNKVKLIGAALRQKNPNLKYIGYGALFLGNSNQIGYAFINLNHENWFIHIKGLDPTNPQNRLKYYDGSDIFDITNQDLQIYMASQITQNLADSNLSGLVSDEVHTELRHVDQNQIPDGIKQNWTNGWIGYITQIKRYLGADRLIFLNADIADQTFNAQLLQVTDGLVFEDPIGAVSMDFKATERYARLLPNLETAASLNKYITIFVNTNINGTTFQTTNQAQESAWQRYYLAAYLNLFRNPKQFLVYYTPSQVGDQFTNELFFKDWNLKIGQPSESMQEPSPLVFVRHFTNGLVVWNNSTSSYQLTSENPSLVTPEGVTVQNYVVPPKSGAIFTTAAPTPTPTPTVNPTPTSTPTASLGPVTVARNSCNGAVPSVELSWSAYPGNVFYQVLETDSQDNIARGLPITQSTFIGDNPTKNNNPYLYQVKTYDVSTNRLLSTQQASLTTLACHAPNNFRVARNICNGSATSVELAWDQYEGNNILYQVLQIDSSDNIPRGLPITTVTAVADSPLSNHTYTYQVRAYSTISSQFSQTSQVNLTTPNCANPTPAPPPTYPTTVPLSPSGSLTVARNLCINGGTSVELAWDAPSIPGNFLFQVTQINSTDNMPRGLPISQNRYIADFVYGNNTVYTYQLKSINPTNGYQATNLGQIQLLTGVCS